jgi:hypothetical protein
MDEDARSELSSSPDEDGKIGEGKEKMLEDPDYVPKAERGIGPDVSVIAGIQATNAKDEEEKAKVEYPSSELLLGAEMQNSATVAITQPVLPPTTEEPASASSGAKPERDVSNLVPTPLPERLKE